MGRTLSWLLASVLFGAMSATPLPARAYTLKTTDSGAQIRWSEDAVAIRLAPYSKLRLNPEDMLSALVMATEAWRGYDRVPDIFVNGGEPASPGHHGDSPTNGIYVIEDWPYESNKLAVTVTTYGESSGKLLDADILVNPDASLKLLPESDKDHSMGAYDVASILTHEVGHVLGLGESDTDPMATMWPLIAFAETHKRTLEEDDEAGVMSVYAGASPESVADTAGCGKMTVTRGGARPSSALIPLMAMLLLWLACRKHLAVRKQCTVALACGAALCLASPTHPANPRAVEQLDGARTASSKPASSLVPAHRTATERLEALMAGASRAHRGIARKMETSNENGMFWTRYRVVTAEHGQLDLLVPGGTVNGITQRVGQEAPPADGEEIVIVPRPNAAPGWAHYRDGRIYGGSLGYGPAIESPF